ncbi:MAG: hypothetical protein KDK89_19910, partial [Alphaproteobacteria bacterium]|nr:hypothetical protein [Alphaproteobacteria bacterium]
MLASAASAGQTQVLVGKHYQLPLGNYSTPLQQKIKREEPGNRLVPIGDAALMAIKQQAESSASNAAAVAPAAAAAAFGPDRLDVGKKCITNAATGFAPSDIHGAANKTRM